MLWPKGYYRRAHAFIALNQLTKAIKDLEKLSTLVPKDVKVANMLKRCSEHLMKSSMRCALSQSPSVKSPFDMLDIKSQLPSSYSGPKIDLKHITHDTVMQVIDHFKQGKSLHHTQISKIKIAAVEYFKQQPNIVRLDAPSADGAKMTICGDVHGQFYDFINIFEINGYPSEKNIYVIVFLLFGGLCHLFSKDFSNVDFFEKFIYRIQGWQANPLDLWQDCVFMLYNTVWLKKLSVLFYLIGLFKI